jgi:hypothetical protein
MIVTNVGQPVAGAIRLRLSILAYAMRLFSHNDGWMDSYSKRIVNYITRVYAITNSRYLAYMAKYIFSTGQRLSC